MILSTSHEAEMPFISHEHPDENTVNPALLSINPHPPPCDLYSVKMLPCGPCRPNFLSGARYEFFRKRAAQTSDQATPKAHTESRELNSHPNSLGLFARLPPELHFSIFELLVFDDDIQPTVDGWIPQTWIVEITHVCAYWRSFAISQPTLWTKILNFSDLDCAEAMISRSGRMLLNVRIHIPDPSDPESLLPIFAKFSQVSRRTKTLKFSGEPIAFDCSWLPSFSCNTILGKEWLTRIRMTLPILHEFDASTDICTFLNENLFGLNAPSLQDINLLNYNFAWNSRSMPSFPSLRSLKIGIFDTDSEDSTRVYIRDFIPLLSTMPLLTDIYLREVFLRLSNQDRAWHLAHPIPVSLMRLNYLHLEGSHESSTLFLQHVSFPTEACVTIKGGASELQDCEKLLRILENRLKTLISSRGLFLKVQDVRGRSHDSTIRTITVILGDSNMRVPFDVHDDLIPHRHQYHPPIFTLMASFNSTDCYTILQRFRLYRIQVVTIDSHWIEFSLWKHLSTIPNLQLLRFVRVDFGYLDFRRQLTWVPEQWDGTAFVDIAQNGHTCFKSLAVVVAEGCSFPPCWTSPNPRIVGEDLFGFPLYNSRSSVTRREPREDYAKFSARKRLDPTFDRHRLLQFLEYKRLGQRRLQLRLVNCENMTNEIVTSFRGVADVVVE